MKDQGTAPLKNLHTTEMELPSIRRKGWFNLPKLDSTLAIALQRPTNSRTMTSEIALYIPSPSA